MRPEIILHVGTEKTGSTSIQSMLSDSYSELIASQTLFPSSLGAPGHIHFTACALANKPLHPIRNLLSLKDNNAFNEFVSETKIRLKQEISVARPSKIIISDEHIAPHLSDKETLLALKNMCSEFGEVTSVIIYLREQDDFRLSLFSEAVKSGNLKGFDPLQPLPIFHDIPYRLDYLAILNNLSSVFGKHLIFPRIYDRNLFPDMNVCADFINICGINLTIPYDSKPEQNKSIDARVIKHLAYISSFLNNLNYNWSEKLRQTIIRNCRSIFSGPGVILSTEAHINYMRQFSAKNDLIQEAYFNAPENGRHLFPQRYMNRAEISPVYPDCSISWLKLTINYFIGIFNNHTVKKKPDSRGKNLLKGSIPEKNKLEPHIIEASCPICGSSYFLDTTIHSREGKLCPKCGASGRSQAIAYHISKIIYGGIIALRDHKIDKKINIVGLSDGKIYADILKQKYEYINTYYHRAPFLDISNPDKILHNKYDILITTEVFEHVIGPSTKPFLGSYHLLKPGGHIILTVPYINKGDSIEHYASNLIGYEAYKNEEGLWVAELEYSDGRKAIDSNAKFHGGPGKTLEIRLFNRGRVLEELNFAGFCDIETHDENLPQYGINWGPASRVITARKPLI